jgi:hypothetical protein
MATEDADYSPARKAGQPSAVSEILSPTAPRITAHPSRPISASQFFSVSAFSLAPAALHEAVTVNNSYGKSYKRKNGSNLVLVGIPFFTISYNKSGDGPVTLVTLP